MKDVKMSDSHALNPPYFPREGLVTQTESSLIVAAAVIVREGLVLISRRPEGSRHAGFWEFPGGKLEPEETLEECIVREIREELDLLIDVEKKLMVVSHTYPEYHLNLHAFLCRVSTQEDGDALFRDCIWCPPQMVKYYRLLPPDRVIAGEVASLAPDNAM
jgi:8-oxo-dGTP diphosphatase